MKKEHREFNIKFAGLKLGEHLFEFQLDKKFFELYGYEDFLDARISAKLKLVKKENSLDLFFFIDGEVSLSCDITNEPFKMPLKDEMEVVVKFGETLDDTAEDLLILPQGEHYVNVAQYFYELAVLAVPLKRVSPAVKEGKKGQEILKKLKNLQPGETHESEEKETDPRWSKLKDLLN